MFVGETLNNPQAQSLAPRSKDAAKAGGDDLEDKESFEVEDD